MKEEKEEYRATFIERPKPGQIVRVYTPEGKILDHGRVIQVIESNVSESGKMSRTREVCLLEHVGFTPTYMVHYFLDQNKIKFVDPVESAE